MGNSGFGFELTGVKEMMRLFDQLPTVAMQKSVVKKALLKAAKPTADAAKGSAPYDPGITKGFEKSPHLRDTIFASPTLKASQKRGRKIDRTSVEVYVGSTSPHAHLVEYGTVMRETKSGANRGKMVRTPFMRNAWDTTKHNALNIFAKEMEKQLMKAAARLAKKAEKGTLGKAQLRGLLK